MGAKKKIVQQGSSINCYASNGKLVASITCIDAKVTSLAQRGLAEFSSLTAHRLFRWQIRIGFENWIHRKTDPRLVTTFGGYEGIARLIGCGSSHKSIGIVKALLYAQAYSQFYFPDGSQGNMIILREVERHINGEPSKISVIFGECLLPNYTYLLPKGEKRRLIPIPILPPLIGSNNTHSSQAFLQLLLLEEVSDQSRAFAERGYIHLPRERWLELSTEAGVSRLILEKVLDRWEECDFLKRERSQKDGYVLGGSYFQLIEFLRDQGILREEGSKAVKKNLTRKVFTENME